MIAIEFDHPEDGTPVRLTRSAEGDAFTVGRSPDSELVLSPAEVSRTAVTIAVTDDGQVKVIGGQRYGYVQVTRADGVQKATLAVGEEVVCGEGAYRVAIRTSTEVVLDLVVTVAARRRLELPGQLTVGVWSREQIFNPYPENDLRWLAALAAVVAQRPARRKGDALTKVAKAWHQGDWSANLQKRLDKVREFLDLPDTSANKQDQIATWVHTTGVIPPKLFAEFEATVRDCAAEYLEPADLSHLGWRKFAEDRRR